MLKGVPTILMVGPYRMYFHSHEPNEPPHVHVDRDDQSASSGWTWLRWPETLASVRWSVLEKWHERFLS
jgi:hypothetical protein